MVVSPPNSTYATHFGAGHNSPEEVANAQAVRIPRGQRRGKGQDRASHDHTASYRCCSWLPNECNNDFEAEHDYGQWQGRRRKRPLMFTPQFKIRLTNHEKQLSYMLLLLCTALTAA